MHRNGAFKARQRPDRGVVATEHHLAFHYEACASCGAQQQPQVSACALGYADPLALG